MTTSGTVSTTAFNTQKVIDHAFRRCRLRAQQISAEMLAYARDDLYLVLSRLASTRTPSWCIEKQIYPFYAGNPVVTLDLGTVEVLNANYRTVQTLSGTTTTAATSRTTQFSTATAVTTVGLKWSASPPALLTFATSPDGISWTTVGTHAPTASAGEWSWVDITPTTAELFFRVSAAAAITVSDYVLANTPQEIPMGVLNRDTFVAQSNKTFQGRPITYWFERRTPQPVMNLWPAPDTTSEYAQLIVWRHRHIMDVGPLAGEVEVPQRWMDAIVDALAAKLAAETPEVDAQLIPILEARAAQSLREAWEGDNDGSPTYIQPRIAAYTR